MLKPIEASYNLKLCAGACARTCPVVVVDTIMLGAWPKVPTATFNQSRGRISSQLKFSVVDL